MTTYSTDFSSYTADAPPSDWSDFWAAGGASYTVRDDGPLVGGLSANYLEVDIGTVGARRAFTWDTPGSVSDVDIYCRIEAPYATLDTDKFLRLLARVSGTAAAENAYFLSIGNDAVNLYKYVSGTATTVASVACQYHWATCRFWCRFQLIGSTIRCKIWHHSASEPADWLLTATDTDLTSGHVGVGTFPENSDFKVDYFSVNDNPPATADFPPPGFTVTSFGGFEACDYSAVATGPLVRAMGGWFGDINALLHGAFLSVGTTHTDQVRLAVYSGGDLATGPAGATLLADCGLTSGTATNTTITVSGDAVAIPKNQPLWLVMKSDGGFAFKYGPVGNAGNFQTARGRYDFSAGISGDPDVAFPATLTGTTGSFSTASWYPLWAVIEQLSATPAPEFSPAAGGYPQGTAVVLSCTWPNATIYYTTDGSTPTTASPVYTGPITLDSAKTIKAIATSTELADSSVAEAAYTIEATSIGAAVGALVADAVYVGAAKVDAIYLGDTRVG